MQIPIELWDSAQIDGAGHIRYLLQVVVPLSKAPIVTVVLFGFIGSWNALAWPILVTTTEEWRVISYGLLAFIDDAGACVEIDRLNIGPIPTNRLNWLQPHEGNIIEFLYRNRAYQMAEMPVIA